MSDQFARYHSLLTRQTCDESEAKPTMRAIKTAAEQDAYTPWRKYLCYLARPGVVNKIKRATHRRERREGKAEIREQLE